MQINSHKFYIDKVIQPIKVKMQKITLFISLSDQDLPMIPLRKQYLQQFITQTRMYFNDKELLIYKNLQTRQSYLTSSQFQSMITFVLNKKLDNKKSYEQINFVDVIEDWLMNDTLVQVFYPTYEDIIKTNVSEYLMSVQKNIAIILAKQKNKTKLTNQQQHKQSIIHSSSSAKLNIKNNLLNNKKLTIQTTQKSSSKLINNQLQLLSPTPKSTLQTLTPSQQPTDTFTYYLQKFYIHYAKKSPNTNKTQQFQQLQHFYTTINLNKFMLYCKEIGLLKIDKKITINFVKKLFVNNQDQRKVVQFDAFSKIIKEILIKVFKTQEIIKQKGYELIGVKDRKNFVQTMGKIGVLVPLKKIVFAKAENKRQKKVDLQLLQKLKSIEKKQQKESKQAKRLKQNNSLSKLQKQKILNNGGYPNQMQPKINQHLKKSPSLGTLPTLYSHQPPKQDKILQQLLEFDVQNQDDPYLQRFKDQQKRYQLQQQKQREKYRPKQSNSKDKNNWGQGVMERMDRRMENVVRKVR